MANTATRLSAALLWTVLAGCANANLDERDPDEPVTTSNTEFDLDQVQLQPTSNAPPSDEEIAAVEEVNVRADFVMPVSIDLRPLMSPIRDQLFRGTCTAFASTSLAEFHANMMEPDQPHDFSEQFLYYQEQSNITQLTQVEGVDIFRTLKELASVGIVAEQLWPYEARSWQSQGSHGCTTSIGGILPFICYTNGRPPQAAQDADRFRTKGPIAIASTANDARKYLAVHQEPLAVGFAVDIAAWRTGLFTITQDTPREEDCNGGHAVAIVGYDDEMRIPMLDRNGSPVRGTYTNEPLYEKGGFIIRNSWGAGWGDHGYGYMSYEYFERFAHDHAYGVHAREDGGW